ncbi:MAG TPA: hypothetical protein VGJ15_12310 [Pirellulales bacterium]
MIGDFLARRFFWRFSWSIAMVYRGHVKKGVVVLEDDANLAEGTEVTVQPLSGREKKRPARRSARRALNTKPKAGLPKSPRKSINAGLERFAGIAKDLPADASVNLDHYLYGAPKRK